LLPQLVAAKQNCEKILTQNKIRFVDFDKLFKSFYEYLPGQRKEAILNPHLEILMQKDLGVFEKEMFELRTKALRMKAIDPSDI
jgi:hypothetical protein